MAEQMTPEQMQEAITALKAEVRQLTSIAGALYRALPSQAQDAVTRQVTSFRITGEGSIAASRLLAKFQTGRF